MQLIGEALRAATARNKNVMIYGPPFRGKTTSLATLMQTPTFKEDPKTRLYLWDLDYKCDPVIRLATEQGWLDRLVVYRYVPSGGAKLTQTQHTPRRPDTYLQIMQDVNALHDMVDHATGYWRSALPFYPGAVAFDGLTSYGDILLEYVMNMLAHNLGDPGTHSGSDYGKQMGKIVETIKSLKALPCIFVLLAHEEIRQDETSGRIISTPMVTGKLRESLAREFNVAFYASTRSEVDPATKQLRIVYEWLTRPEGQRESLGTTERDDLPLRMPQDFSLLFK